MHEMNRRRCTNQHVHVINSNHLRRKHEVLHQRQRKLAPHLQKVIAWSVAIREQTKSSGSVHTLRCSLPRNGVRELALTFHFGADVIYNRDPDYCTAPLHRNTGKVKGKTRDCAKTSSYVLPCLRNLARDGTSAS